MQTTAELLAILDAAGGKRVLVIGDLYLDTYISGETRGLSPEAPVPLIETRSRRCTPGGAGNVAAGIAALGAAAQLVGVIGSDAEAEALLAACRAAAVATDGLTAPPGAPTNVRTRVAALAAHSPERAVLRIDTPRPPYVTGETEAALIHSIETLAGTVDAVVIIESGAGVASPAVIAAAQRIARASDILLVGDVSGQAQFLRGYDIVAPNEREAAQLLGLAPEAPDVVAQAGRRLVDELGNRSAAVTRGPAGIALFTPEGREDVPTFEREVFDPTGAGDTVCAALTVALLGGATVRQAAEIANLAASVAVGRPGTAIVGHDDLCHAMAEYTTLRKGEKLCSRDELATLVHAARAQGKKVVFTNGCFDLIHPGHVTYLQQAARLGDALIVALNSDASVQSLKGPSRPILKQDERVMIMAALECVTWVTVFDEKRVTGLLDELTPDVWVKGGDYTIDSLDAGERAAAQRQGTQIALIPPVAGISTTDIVRRIEEAGKRTDAK